MPPMEPAGAPKSGATINDINTASAALLLQLSAYGGREQQQRPQQSEPQQSEPQQSEPQQQSTQPLAHAPQEHLHPLPQCPVVQSQPGQFLHFPGGAMTMTAGAGPTRMHHFSER